MQGPADNGVAVAITNIAYPATGRRVRDLPITPVKLLLGLHTSS